ncbi:MAG: NAD(P)/FAD-dependent oxidoreductase [Candidatus Nitrosocaldus sp.]
MHRYDVAVAGGGIIGLTIAYELRMKGFNVAILDGNDSRMASSYGNAGYVSPSLGSLSMNVREVEDTARYLASKASTTSLNDSKGFMTIKSYTNAYTDRDRFNDPSIRMLIRTMALESKEWYARMSSDLGFVYKHSGLLEVYLTRDGLEHRLEHVKHLASILNIPYKVLAMDEVHTLEPSINDVCEGALFYPDDAFVNPRSVIRALRDTLTTLDAVFLDNLESIEWDEAPVGSSNHNGRRIRSFKTISSSIYADTYIVCTGAYRVDGLYLPIAPARGYMLELRSNDSTLLMLEHPLLCGEHRISISMHEGLRITAFFELCSIGSAIVEGNFDKLLELARKYIAMGDVAIVDRWVGYRPCTPDGLPIIGRIGDDGYDHYSNLIVAGGHCRLGITLAPATARLVASLVEGNDVVPDALKPNRYGL